MLADLWLHKIFGASPSKPGCYQDPESDSELWRLGVIFYALLTGHIPFFDKNLSIQQKNIKNYEFQPLKNEKMQLLFEKIFCC